MRSDSPRPQRGLFVGLAILSVGIILLLDQEGIISADRVFFYFWPSIFIFLGVENLFFCTTRNRRIWGWIFLIFGVLLLGSQLGFRFLRPQDIWPCLIIFAGIVLVARSFLRLGFWPESWQRWRWDRPLASDENASSEAQFDYLAIFGGVNQRIYSKNFRGGNLMALCGGFDLDFRRADIEGESAVIDASAFMGGGQIRVPDTWIVDMRGTAVLGGYTDETAQEAPPPGATQKRLIVKGVVVFGGVVVKN